MKKSQLLVAICLTTLSVGLTACSEYPEVKQATAEYLVTLSEDKTGRLTMAKWYFNWQLHATLEECGDNPLLRHMLIHRDPAAGRKLAKTEALIETLEEGISLRDAYSQDWKVWEAEDYIYVVKGYGLGWDSDHYCVGCWYYRAYPDGRVETEPAGPYAHSLLVEILQYHPGATMSQPNLLPFLEPEPQDLPRTFSTYSNDTWGYSISYPSGWTVEESGQRVYLVPPPVLCIGRIAVEAEEGLTLPAEMAAQTSLEVAREVWGDVIVRDNEAMRNTWDWHVRYDYIWSQDGAEFDAEAYFKQTGSCLYTLTLDFEKVCHDVYPLSEIVSTFHLLASVRDSEVDAGYLRYESDEYDYYIEYPSDWILDTTEPDLVDLRPAMPECFVAMSVVVHEGEETGLPPIEEIATGYLEAASWVVETLTVEHSGQPESSKWDWLVIYSYPLESIEVTEAVYFKLVSDTRYQFHLSWETVQGEKLEGYGYDLEMLQTLESCTQKR